MASESDILSLSALFQRLMATPLFTSIPTTRPDSEDPDHESTNDRILLINPLTQRMVVIGPAPGSLLTDLTKHGQHPASQASIDGLPSTEIKCEDEVENLGGECVICLEEWRIGDLVNEMPCQHKFHGGCVEKWLKIHGSCPVCRYKMPVDDSVKKIGGEIWVTFAFGNRRSSLNEDSSMES